MGLARRRCTWPRSVGTPCPHSCLQAARLRPAGPMTPAMRLRRTSHTSTNTARWVGVASTATGSGEGAAGVAALFRCYRDSL